MITVTVRYFALFREQAGLDAEQLSGDFASAADVFAASAGAHGIDEPRRHCKVAINDALAEWSDAVADGDTLLLFPPVAGG